MRIHTRASLRRGMRQVGPLAVLFVLLASALPVGTAPVAARAVVIAANTLTLPPDARVLGPVAAHQPIHLVVGLAPRHAEMLDAFLRLRARPGSPLYHRTLTPGQFADLFGATRHDEESVVAYLRAHALRTMRVYRDRLALDVIGTAAAVGQAFGTTLVRYRDRRGRVYYANATAPRLPARLAALVSAVVGLRDDAPMRHAPLPRIARQTVPRQAVPRQTLAPHGDTMRRSRRAAAVPRALPTPPEGMLTPAQIRAAYNVTPLYTQTFSMTAGLTATATITGAGETIAVYELSPYKAADIAAYDAAFGLAAPPPVNVPVDGGAVNSFGNTGSAEAALDIELVHALAPGAQILVYSGFSSPASTDNTAADDTYARIVNDDRAQILSTSWGQCEQAQQADQPPDFTLLHTLFAQAVAEGMTVVASSGDAGAYDCLSANGLPDTTLKAVDYPASDPYVIAVGGTALALDGGGGVTSESAWSDSGGGLSNYFARPAWQVGPGTSNALSNGKRQVPDVAVNAAMSYAVWVSGAWQPVHGTSAGPPLWSALLALANQARYVAAQVHGTPAPLPCVTRPGLGDIHAELYLLGASSASHAYRDITAGPGNGMATPGPGWDYSTGWGSPNASALLRALIAVPALAAPTIVRCPTVTATPRPTPFVSATPASTPPPPSTTMRAPAHGLQALILRAIPGVAHAGSAVVLDLRGPTGHHSGVRIELRYPDGWKVWWIRSTDARGHVAIRIRTRRLTSVPRRGGVVVTVRGVEQIGTRTLTAQGHLRLVR